MSQVAHLATNDTAKERTTPAIAMRGQAPALQGSLRLQETKSLLGVGTNGYYPVAPPSEPAVRFSRNRLSSWWFYLQED